MTMERATDAAEVSPAALVTVLLHEYVVWGIKPVKVTLPEVE